MKVPKSVANLIEAFESLPGIGPKTAARLTYYLLHAPDQLSQKLADAAHDIKLKTKICPGPAYEIAFFTSDCQTLGSLDGTPKELVIEIGSEKLLFAINLF